MSRTTQPQKQNMTPLQKQAVLVCVICALAALLTLSITLSLLKKGKAPSTSLQEPASSSEELPADPSDISEHYQIDRASEALLTETADAGSEYLETTVFLGDSNTVRLFNNGLISLQQFCAKEGIGTQAALTEKIVTFKKDENRYTIAQAVAKMKPRRVLMTFGTNDAGMPVEDFIASYSSLVKAIQQSYPYTDIIVNTVPPVPQDHSAYPDMDQARIDDFNMALLEMCEELGVKFLNSAEALKGEDGYGNPDYYTSGDIHLKSAGLKAMLSYLRTHACQTEDRRPDTNNIPTRTLEYVSNPSSAVAAPSSSESTSTSASKPESESTSSAASSSSAVSSSSESSGSLSAPRYEVVYRVYETGGTLRSGNESGKTSLRYSVTGQSEPLTVTAVPEEGYLFVKWSDGETDCTRTDSDICKDTELFALFSKASVKISGEGRGTLGTSYTFRASLDGKYASAKNLHWYANGQEIKEAAGLTTIAVMIDPSMLDTSYKIYAAIVYNDCKVPSNTLTISLGSGVSSETKPGESGTTSERDTDSSQSTDMEASSTASSKTQEETSSSAASSDKAGSGKEDADNTSSREEKTDSSAESEPLPGGNSAASSKTEASASKEAATEQA